MNIYEVILMGALCLFIVGLIVLNVLNLGLWVCPIFLCTDLIYQTMFSVFRLRIREEFKDKVVCWTNRFSTIFMAIGTVNLIKFLMTKN